MVNIKSDPSVRSASPRYLSRRPSSGLQWTRDSLVIDPPLDLGAIDPGLHLLLHHTWSC